MMRSLYSGVSGLKNHQTRMDVIANNIANVNTVGYKTSRVVFQDIFSQTSRSAAAPSGVVGGTNPIQVGLGVILSAIDVIHTESAFARSDRPLDFMISGEGYFVIETPNETLYTRAGNFYIDDENYLVNSAGYYVLGFADDEPPTAAPPVYDPATPFIPDDLNRIKVAYEDDDGNERRYMNISVDKNGVVSGKNIDDEIEIIGYLSIATFNNTSGLEKAGGTNYRVSNNSGEPTIFLPNSREIGSGEILAGGLEMSNVDLANEFTDMIITQRGFQANSRSITVSDTLLEELINLKR
ncbi:MAG: flagellar hook-basal body complex protein [Clostridiales bacterium]|nr:flagellar hook-basal body complex protein [Clostridiales bacterium]